jgi:acyl-CoA thioesterase FadM
MQQIKIELPVIFTFTTRIPVRITDLNYGNHVGNDAVLAIIHEARMQFLRSHGYTEMDFGGSGMIMRDACIGFELFYKLEKETPGKIILVAAAKTGMICFDYAIKKIIPVPDEARKKLSPGVTPAG